MSIGIEEGTYGRQVGDEEEVKHIDVKSSSSYVLQASSNHRELREIILEIAEIHEHDGQQRELGYGAGQIGPLKTQGVPLQYVQRANDDYHSGCP